jgi:hypothetical protein
MSGSGSTRRSSSYRHPSPSNPHRHNLRDHQTTDILQHPSVARLLGFPGGEGGQGSMAVDPQPILLHSSTRSAAPHSVAHHSVGHHGSTVGRSTARHAKAGGDGGAAVGSGSRSRRLHSAGLTHPNGRGVVSRRPPTPDFTTHNTRRGPSQAEEAYSSPARATTSRSTSSAGGAVRQEGAREAPAQRVSSRPAADPTVSSDRRRASRKEEFLREMGLVTEGGSAPDVQSPHQRRRSAGASTSFSSPASAPRSSARLSWGGGAEVATQARIARWVTYGCVVTQSN